MMAVTLLGPASVLNRQSGRRADPAYLKALADDPQARFMLMTGLEPIVRADTTQAIRSVWFSHHELARAGFVPSPTVFLGIAEGTDIGHFAVRLNADEASRIAASHALAPAGDFRALASSGALTTSDVALAGLSRSLFAWHDSARHCGWCGAAP